MLEKKNKKAMIVSDDEGFLRWFKRVLRLRGHHYYEVAEVHSGPSAHRTGRRGRARR